MASTMYGLNATTTCVGEAERPWVDSGGGTWTQLLRVSAASGEWLIRNRFEPGYRAPTHRHTGQVHAFTQTGHWGYEEYDFVAGPGSYVHEQAGVVHTLVIPEDNNGLVEILFLVEGGNINFSPNGEYIGFTDGRSVLGHYLERCQAQGFGRPEGILE
jgi:2,4'-dihydroxyacetophenone dioxygenase